MNMFTRLLMTSTSAAALALCAANTAGAAVTDYPNGSTNAAPIVLTASGTQLQVTTGSATQSGVISSTGTFGIEKIGAGQLNLSAVNTYTGQTIITAGSLALSGTGGIAASSLVINNAAFDISGTTAGTSIKGLTGTGAVALGAQTLTLTGSTTSASFGGVISGTGGLVVATGNNEGLTGANTYTGGTTLGTGAFLTVGSGGTAGSIVGNVANGGTLAFRRSDAVTYAGVISGTGAVSQLGSGTLTLTGVNTFTGRLLINPGTVALSGNGSVASASSVRTFGNFDISQTNAGATIQSLELVPVGSNPFTGLVSLGSKTLTISNASTEFDGTLQDGGIAGGTGGRVTLLAGTETFGGVNTYTGATTISGGTLALAGAGSIAASSGVTDNGVFDISGTTSGASIRGLTGTGAVALGARTLTLTGSTISASFGGVISGTGGVVVATGNNEGLTGANTYTGGTTLSTGAFLTVGAGGTSGAIVGNVANNGTLAFRRSDALTYAGVISGTGAVSQLGAGTLTLTGVNTYTGRTLVNPGTLALSGAGSIAASSVRVFGTFDISGTTNGAAIQSLELIPVAGQSFTGAVFLGGKTLTITNAANEFDGVLQDSGIAGGTGGSVAITGGTEVFGGNNTYTGGTTIASGATLQLGTGGTAGGITGDIVDNGSLIVNRSDTLNVASLVSGSGGVTKLGANTMTLLGANTYTGGTTIAAGTLQIGNGGTAGSIAGDVTDNATLAFNHSDNVTFVGVISGSGALNQAGGGMLTLSGASTYSGATTVSTGSLNVTGAIGSSAVTVASGATLAGTGTVGSTTISAGGILAPGATTGSVGTLAVNGNLSLDGASIFNADITPSAADAVTVSGTAGIAGTLNAVFASGTYNATQYTLVSSAGTLSGTFSSYNVTGLPANFNSALSYDAHDVFLVLSSTLSATTTANVNSGTVTVSGNQTTGGLASSGPGGNVNITNGSSLTDNQSSNTTYSGTITGGGSFTKTGSGALILDGVNTYTGGTAVNGGILEIGDVTHPGASILGPVTVGSGGTLQGHGTINGAVTIGSGGTFNPGGSIGTTTVGSVAFASGSTYAVETNAAGQSDKIIATGAVTIASGANLVVSETAPLSSYGRTTTYSILTAGAGVTGSFSNVTSSAAGFLPSLAYSTGGVSLTLQRTDMLTGLASGANQSNVAAAVVAGGGSAIAGALAGQSDAVVQASFGQLAGDIHASLRSAAVEDSRIIRDTVLDHLNSQGDATTVWAAGFGGYGSIAGDGNAAGLHHDSAGFIAGADMLVGEGFRLGLAGAYTSNNASVTGHASTAHGDSGHVVAYGGWSDGAIDLKLGGDFGWGKADVARTLAAFAQVNTNRQDQKTDQVFGEAGYRIAGPGAMIEPYVGIANVSATTGAFAETGGSAALSGGEKTDTQTYSTLGMRASLAPMRDLGDLVPHIDLGWQHALGSFRPGQTETLQSLSQSFTVLGAPLARDAAAVRFGFGMMLSPDATVSVDYDGSFASAVQNNAVRGMLAWKF